jgi:hypothetical protein
VGDCCGCGCNGSSVEILRALMEPADAFPLIFLMIGLQCIAMVNNNSKIAHMEQVLALEINNQNAASLELSQYEEMMLKAIKAQVDRSLAAKVEREEQYAHLQEIITKRSSDRITRTEILSWRNELENIFPFLPEIPVINSPGDRKPIPLLP